jgi:hypothetical protein
VQAPGWELVDGATRIERTYRFKNFREAFAFVESASPKSTISRSAAARVMRRSAPGKKEIEGLHE